MLPTTIAMSYDVSGSRDQSQINPLFKTNILRGVWIFRINYKSKKVKKYISTHNSAIFWATDQTWPVTTLGFRNCWESRVFLAIPVLYQSQCCLMKLSHRLVPSCWDQLSQLTGHNLYPRYMQVRSNLIKKSAKHLWYWYPALQSNLFMASSTCFLTGVLWALILELLWSNFKKWVTTMTWEFSCQSQVHLVNL